MSDTISPISSPDAGVIAVNGAVERLIGELRRARQKHPTRMRSKHEGFAILKEEIDELWDAIKADAEPAERIKEAVQCGAMILAYLTEVEGLEL